MKNIAIIMGGYSSEVNISLRSGNVVYNNLDKDKYSPYRVLILEDKWVVLDDNDHEYPINRHDFSTEINGKKITFHCVFNAIHGDPGENGMILAYFDLIGMKHTSAPWYQMALTYNKRDTLSVLKAYDIKMAHSIYINKGDDIDTKAIIEKLGLPCFVKPNNAGSSIGMSKVFTEEEFPAAFEKAFHEDTEILIESFLEGTEVSIGVIKYDGEIKVLAPTEVITDNSFFDYEAKYVSTSKEVTPARISAARLTRLNEVALKVYKVLKLEGFSRSEFIFIGDEPHFLEVNTVPGLTDHSFLPKQAAHAGISLGDLFSNAIEEALK